MRTISRLATSLVLFVTAACADDQRPESTDVRLDFERSIPAFETVAIDTGLVEVAEGVSVRTVTTFDSGWSFAASGYARGDVIEPIDGTGSIAVGGAATVELYADVTRPDYEFSGLVATQTFDFETDIASFDPFLIDEPLLFGHDTPAKFRMYVDPASGTGLGFVAEMSVWFFPTYEGKCLRIDQETGTAQYTMLLQPVGDLTHQFGVDFVSALGRVELGRLGIDLDFGEYVGVDVDLGKLSVEDGSAVEDPGPCDG